MSAETKAQIIAESFTGEASVSEVALAVNGGDRILQLCGGKTSSRDRICGSPCAYPLVGCRPAPQPLGFSKREDPQCAFHSVSSSDGLSASPRPLILRTDRPEPNEITEPAVSAND